MLVFCHRSVRVIFPPPYVYHTTVKHEMPLHLHVIPSLMKYKFIILIWFVVCAEQMMDI